MIVGGLGGWFSLKILVGLHDSKSHRDLKALRCQFSSFEICQKKFVRFVKYVPLKIRLCQENKSTIFELLGI